MIDLQLIRQDYEELNCLRSDLSYMLMGLKKEPLHVTNTDSLYDAIATAINIIAEKQFKMENYIHEHKDKEHADSTEEEDA